MRPHTHFEIEFSSPEHGSSPLALRMGSEIEVLDFAKANLRSGSELFVACLADGIDYGNLIIEFDGENSATITVHEHQGYVARGVSESEVLEALEYWLPSQERTSALEWRTQ